VGWACNLYSDLLGHWSKRNRHDVQNYNPVRLDRELFRDLCRRYGTPLIQDRLHSLEAGERMTGPDEDSSMLAELCERLDIARRNRPAYEHSDLVAAAGLAQTGKQLRGQRKMRAGKNTQSDRVDVLLHRGGDNLVDAAPKPV
jgi:hypothetical protein